MEQDLIIKKDHLIKYTGSSKEVVIPDGIKRISEDAFCWCESIESVEIPKSVTSIGNDMLPIW